MRVVSFCLFSPRAYTLVFSTHLHVVELFFVAAPDRVVEPIVLRLDAKPLVRVVEMDRRAGFSAKDTLRESKAPKLDGNVLRARLLRFGVIQVNWRAVELLVGKFDAGYLQDCRGEIRVRGRSARDSLCWDARASDNEGHVDVCLEAACFAGVQSVLANVVAVVGRVKDEGVVQHASLLEAGNDGFDNVVDGLQGLQTQPLVLVVVVNDGVVELGELRHPADAAGGIGVEVGRPGDLVLGEEALVPLCHLRGIEGCQRAFADEGVRSNGRESDEERRAVVLERMVEELVRALGDDVRGVFAYGVGGRRSVLGGADVVVLVGEWVEEEVGLGVAADGGRVVVVDGVGVEELACVVGVVAGLLEPEGEVVIIVSVLDKFGISACFRLEFRDLIL